MDGRLNVAEAPEIMVSRRPPNPVEKGQPSVDPAPNSPLENTPHKAGVEGGTEIVAATGAAIAMPAERSGTAPLDGPHDFPLRPGDAGAAAREEASAVGTENIGHLQGGPVHNAADPAAVSFGNASSGLVGACRCRLER